MKSSNELWEMRVGKIAELQVISDSAPNGLLSDEQSRKFDELNAEAKSLFAEYERALALEDLTRQKAQDKSARKTEEQKIVGSFNLGRAVKRLAHGKALEGAEREVHQEGLKECNDSGVSADERGITLPRLFVDYGKRTDYNATTAADGQSTIATELRGMVAPLRPQSVILANGATFLQGLNGDVSFNPIERGSVAWEGEVDAAARYYGAISTKTLQPKRVGAYLTISDKLLRQSEYVIEQFLVNELNIEMGLGLDAAFIEGGGAGEPTGILADSGIALRYAGGAGTTSGTNADGAAIAYADYKELWKAVAEANGLANNAYFLTTPGVIAESLTTPRQASGVEGNFIMGDAMNVLGYRVVGNTGVPSDLEKGSSGTTLHALIFNGNPASQYIGQWGGTTIIVDPFTGASTAQLNVWVHSWFDSKLIRPTAFAAIKDLIA